MQHVMTSLSSISQGAILTSLPVESMKAYGILTNTTLTPLYKSFLGAAAAIGGMLGSATSVLYQKKIGTIISVRILSISVVFFTALTLIPVHYIFLIFCRAFTSTTIASQFMLMPKFIDLNTQLNKKSIVQTIFSINLNIGILLGYIINLAPFWSSTNCFILATNFLTFISTFFIKDVEKELKSSNVESEIDQTSQIAAPSQIVESQPLQLKFPIARLIAMTISLSAAQLTTGINSILAYASQILANSFPTNPAVGAIIIGVAKIIAMIAAMPVINKCRRKVILACGGAGCVLCNFVLIFAFKADIQWLQIVFVVVFIVCYQFGPGPIILMLWGEMFPKEFQGKLNSLAFTVNWIVNISVTLMYPQYQQEWMAYVVYFCFTIFFGVIALVLIPETFKLSREDIEKQYFKKQALKA